MFGSCGKHTVVLGVECNNSLGESLSDSVHLGSVPTTRHSDADVEFGKGLRNESVCGWASLYGGVES